VKVVSLPAHDRLERYDALLEEERIDLVSAHYSVFGAGKAAARRIPFVQEVQNVYDWLSPEERAAFVQADHSTAAYVCVSAEAARYCDRVMKLSVDKMLIIPNGIDTEALDQARTRRPDELRRDLSLGASDLVFLNVASLHETKAQLALVEALAVVASRNDRAKLLLVGPVVDANYHERLQERIAALGLERSVLLAGQRDDVARFYWMADAFVLPSYREGCSLALAEAVYTGLPAIASEVGAARELLSQVGGLLVEPPKGSATWIRGKGRGGAGSPDNLQFVTDLANAMLTVASSPARAAVPEPLKRSLNQDLIADVHATTFDWLLQGVAPWKLGLGLASPQGPGHSRLAECARNTSTARPLR
jgi:glycosyltransferase involved in cell wall biosynthesis